ncbi:MAG TPA: transketolase [bacterium]|nr:transketolase [bacterium]
MRNAFCAAMVELQANRPFVFLTGDLGFGALEPLQQAMGARFINAGVAEQNMVGVAAGLAANGWQAWAYSIAPFIYARPFEQIRNDVCLHGLPVVMVGNGGGYGYGSMGSSHHALEDYGSLLGLQHMRAFIPAFAQDVTAMVPRLAAEPGPAYLRLGRDEKPVGLEPPAYAPWRLLLEGGGPVLVAVGPLAGPLAAALLGLPDQARPQLWALAELPLDTLPAALLRALEERQHLCVVEEHVAQGGAGAALALHLALAGRSPRRFDLACAQGYRSGYYGSQSFHRLESGLDAESVLKTLARAGAR